MDKHNALTEAYHLAFDVKDALAEAPFGTMEYEARTSCYTAISSLANAMRALEFEVPRRFDGEGRGGAEGRGGVTHLSLTPAQVAEGITLTRLKDGYETDSGVYRMTGTCAAVSVTLGSVPFGYDLWDTDVLAEDHTPYGYGTLIDDDTPIIVEFIAYEDGGTL